MSNGCQALAIVLSGEVLSFVWFVWFFLSVVIKIVLASLAALAARPMHRNTAGTSRANSVIFFEPGRNLLPIGEE